jgi:hypothetical protein
MVTVAFMNAVRQLIAGYEGWEARRVGRLSGWPRRRRWLVFVLLPVLLVCGGGTAVGVPVVWAVGLTAAGKGAANPEAAVAAFRVVGAEGVGFEPTETRNASPVSRPDAASP